MVKYMKSLMKSNIYEFDEKIIICGSCLCNMQPNGFKKLTKINKNVYEVCLEAIHMNMVAHKIASIIRVGKVKEILFASVDASPHCVQLHYITNELKKIMNLEKINIKNIVIVNENLIEISENLISKSKKLSEL